jgi:serine/threonine-protein phosphatase 2B regulatory subunit
MGGESSSTLDDDNGLTPEDFKRYKRETHFADRELVHLAAKYKDLVGSRDLGGTGSIELSDFVSKMNCPNRSVAELMYKMIDSDGQGGIDFGEFVNGLAMFRPGAPLEAKIDACFNAYDEDGGGTVSREEIKKVIMASLEDNQLCVLDADILEELVDNVMAAAMKNPEDTFTKAEFSSLVNRYRFLLDCFEFDVEAIMT